MKIVAYDPGLAGAMAFLDGMTYSVEDMPLKTGLDKKKVVDHNKVFEMLDCFTPDLIMIEAQGVKGDITSRVGAFSMGRTYQSLLIGTELYQDHNTVSIITCKAQEWKKTLGLIAPKGTSDKEKKKITKKFVENTFPKAILCGPQGGF